MRLPTLLAGAVMAPALVWPIPPALAAVPGTSISPQRFALPLNAFPPHSSLLASKIESNAAIRHDSSIPHPGRKSLGQEGRLTGYFMKAVQKNKGHALVMQYLVSEFSSPAGALAASRTQRRDYAHMIRFDPGRARGTNPAVKIGSGEAIYINLLNRRGRVFVGIHLFFARGRELIEVADNYYSTDQNPYGTASVPYFFGIGTKLDAIAKRTG